MSNSRRVELEDVGPGAAVLECVHGLVDEAGGETALREVGSEFAREVFTEETVACVFVAGHCTGGNEVVDSVLCGGLAAGEGVGGFCT